VTSSVPDSGSGAVSDITVQQIMDRLGCSQREIKKAGVNPLTEGSDMSYVADCWFPYDNDTGGTSINVYTFGSAADVSQWVSTKAYAPFAFNSDPDHPGAYVIHASNWAIINQSGDKDVARAIAEKMGKAQVTFYQGSGI
jgi:hypothetical protein